MTTPDAYAVAPSDACRRLEHPVVWAPLPTGDRVQACWLCSHGHQIALAEHRGDELAADRFVQHLRRDTAPVHRTVTRKDRP
jgi:hypothetical protein